MHFRFFKTHKKTDEPNIDREIATIYAMFYRFANAIRKAAEEKDGRILLLYETMACEYPHIFNSGCGSRHQELLSEIVNNLDDLAKILNVRVNDKRLILKELGG